jgi:hypothetical protein
MPDEDDIVIPAVSGEGEKLCCKCPLAHCDERNPGCLIRQAVQADKRLNGRVRYIRWMLNPANAQRRQAMNREYHAERAAGGAR